MILLPGVAAFVLFVLFDVNKIRWHNRVLNLFFPAGSGLLILSLVLCICESGFPGWSVRTALGLLGMAVSAAALIYALFLALPFQKTYETDGGLPLTDSGIYSLCRHPGFWPFLTLLLCLWLTFGGIWPAGAAVLYTGCNFLYIRIQDRYLFPQYIDGYDRYRQAVPFLIPGRKS